MLALFCILTIPVFMWLGQSALLLMAGMPVRARLGGNVGPEWVRVGCRAVLYVAIVGVLWGYPALRDLGIVDYYRPLIQAAEWRRDVALGFCASVLFLAMLYIAWNVADSVRFAVRRSGRRIARRLIMLPFSAALGAGLEELLFRGVLLRGLLAEMPVAPAVAIGAVVFAGAHYMREVKRWWTLPGHVALGVCLCLAFTWTGNPWLAFGLHAGGIVGIMAARPFVRYEGPAWLTGASIFPFAGVVGLAALAVLMTMVRYVSGSGGH